MNVSLVLVGKVRASCFRGLCVFLGQPGATDRAVPVDGSVLCLTGILSVIHGDETHPFTCPAFLQRESRVLWTRVSAVRELKCISATCGLWGARSPGSTFCAALATVPSTEVCRRRCVKHRARQTVAIALCPSNLGFSFW